MTTIKLISATIALNLLLTLPLYSKPEPTTAAGYKEKSIKSGCKTVELPSGAVFKISSINWNWAKFYKKLEQINIEPSYYNFIIGKAKEEYHNMSADEITIFYSIWNILLVECVEKPELCIEEEEGKLSVQSLTFKDRERLEDEIIELLWGEGKLLPEGVEAALNNEIWPEETGSRILSENEAKEVQKIWRVIGDQEIADWDGKEWLSKTEVQKKEAIKRSCNAWRKAGYQRIEPVEYFIKDIDEYYRHFEQKNPKEGIESKAGLVLSLSAFFSGIEIYAR